MTNAREIIAQHLCDRAGQGWSGVSTFERAAYRTAGHGMIATLTAAGFCILGPDEVDQDTEDDVAAELWKAEAEDVGAPASIASGRTRDAFDDQSDELKRRWRKFARAAIRALGRKA